MEFVGTAVDTAGSVMVIGAIIATARFLLKSQADALNAYRVFVGDARVLPGPVTLNFQLESHAKKGANHHDDGKHDEVVESGWTTTVRIMSPATRNSSPKRIARPKSWQRKSSE